jgi:hypothetical protein
VDGLDEDLRDRDNAADTDRRQQPVRAVQEDRKTHPLQDVEIVHVRPLGLDDLQDGLLTRPLLLV